MGNHCIDVVCVGCGSGWCDRGCGWEIKPDPKAAILLQEIQRQKQYYVYKSEGCCKGFDVVSWSIYCDLPEDIKNPPDPPAPPTSWDLLMDGEAPKA